MSVFISVDPLAEEFVGWTPYHYVHQNPANLIDPDGRNAKAVVKGNTIIVKTTIYIRGYNATAKKAKSIENGIKSFWGKNFTYKDKETNKIYKVVFDINVKPQPTDKEGYLQAFKEYEEGHLNVIELKKGNVQSVVNGDGYTGVWGDLETDNTYAHEFGHLLGIADMYYRARIGEYDNYQGVDKNDIMGKNLQDSSARVSQENIDGIAKKVLQDKDENGEAYIGRSFGRSRGNENLSK